MDSLHFSTGPGTQIKFVSLGMVVLDKICFPNGKTLFDVPGGSGLYSTLGARIAATGTTETEEIGSVILAGRDFPASLQGVLRDWGLSLLFKMDPSRLSTRGLLQYKRPNFTGRPDFSLHNPSPPANPADLKGDPNLLRSTAFHFLASPQDLRKFVSSLMSLRAADGVLAQPLMVWEPAPASCTPENRDLQTCAAKLVDVYSPNHTEFLAIFEAPSTTAAAAAAIAPKTLGFDCSAIERHALRLVDRGVGPHGTGVVVIRSGEHGCLVASRSYPARWFPAFYDSNSPKVVDVTGAGNAFLGAFTVMLATAADLTEATITSSVVASLAIEQIGLPRKGISNDKTETWNGIDISSRIDEYRAKLAGVGGPVKGEKFRI
ncbi:Ribokinase-like protein [Apiosordaria backusii]|uniref:Ribokinase-like protein n=1 Tax=Apiosordaria backusii TaxID=314023 RepID=A0AA40E3U2_9PEZI|nr:Ribokinase-like protein [Apiosordaria backusii]